MRFFLITLFSLVIFNAFSQDKCNIEINIPNYDEESILLANYFGDQTLIFDTLVINSEKGYRLTRDTLIPEGMYMAVVQPNNRFFQFIVDKDQEFSMTIDTADAANLVFEGSEENQRFKDYTWFLAEQSEKVAILDESIADTLMPKGMIDKLSNEREFVDVEVKAYQEEILRKHPDSFTAIIIKASQPMDFPEFEGSLQEQQISEFNYYKDHYFDQLDLLDPRLIRTNFLHKRVEYYMEKLVPQNPDSIINELDSFITKIEPANEVYRYYLSHYLNKFANSKIVGQDKVYVHLAHEYYAKGKTPWVKEKTLKKITKEADKIFPILIGKPAPDFTLFMEDGTPVALKEIKEDFVVMFFWKPGCGHCKKATPFIKDFAKNYADKSVKLLSICNGVGKEFGKCWEAVKKKEMEELINVGDQYQKSRILSNYYINSAPKVFILDKERNIVMKGIGAKQLEDVMPRLMGGVTK